MFTDPSSSSFRVRFDRTNLYRSVGVKMRALNSWFSCSFHYGTSSYSSVYFVLMGNAEMKLLVSQFYTYGETNKWKEGAILLDTPQGLECA